jgi:hypothetical protein
MRQSDGVADSHEVHHLLRLWASTRTRHARIARTDRLDMHVPARTEKYWQSGSKEFQQQADANSSCPPQNEVALESLSLLSLAVSLYTRSDLVSYSTDTWIKQKPAGVNRRPHPSSSGCTQA